MVLAEGQTNTHIIRVLCVADDIVVDKIVSCRYRYAVRMGCTFSVYIFKLEWDISQSTTIETVLGIIISVHPATVTSYLLV